MTTYNWIIESTKQVDSNYVVGYRVNATNGTYGATQMGLVTLNSLPSNTQDQITAVQTAIGTNLMTALQTSLTKQINANQ